MNNWNNIWNEIYHSENKEKENSENIFEFFLKNISLYVCNKSCVYI